MTVRNRYPMISAEIGSRGFRTGGHFGARYLRGSRNPTKWPKATSRWNFRGTFKKLGRRRFEPFSGDLRLQVFPDRRIRISDGPSGATTLRAISRASLTLGFPRSTNQTRKRPTWGDDISSSLVKLFDIRSSRIDESHSQMADVGRRRFEPAPGHL